MVFSALLGLFSHIVSSFVHWKRLDMVKRDLYVIKSCANALLLSHRSSMMCLQPRHDSIVHKASLPAFRISQNRILFLSQKNKSAFVIPPKNPGLFQKKRITPPPSSSSPQPTQHPPPRSQSPPAPPPSQKAQSQSVPATLPATSSTESPAPPSTHHYTT